MTTPEDRELEALLREQTLLPVPLALVARILDEVLPAEPVRPWAVAGRTAAAVLVFCASWLAFSGDVPAFADVAAEAHVAAAVGPTTVAGVLPTGVTAAPGLDHVPTGSSGAWLLAGGLLLLAGLGLAWRGHARAAGAGGVR